jgi:hypothetical protein
MDLVIKCEFFVLADDPVDGEACELLVDLLLGREQRDTWIGSISSVPGPKPSSLRMIGSDDDLFHHIETLEETIGRGIAGIVAQLDERPYHRFCEQAAWTLLDVEPRMSNAACVAQDDLILCSTMLPEMLKCFLQGQPFSSLRFSRNAEIFCYLKYRSEQVATEERLGERVALEDALNRALVPGGVGCVVGAGLGLHYGYIDLALARLDHGAQLTQRVFANSALRGPGWLLFCDSEWSHEWIALGPSGEAPTCLREPTVEPSSRSDN